MHNKSGFITATSGLIIIVSIATIAGWLLGIDILKTALPGLPGMKVNTAVCLILCCVVAIFFENDAQKYFNIIIPLNVIALVLSALTLFEYAFNVNLRIDEFLVEESDVHATPGRMALASATCLLMLTTGFSFVAAQAPKTLNRVAQIFFIAVIIIAVLVIVGYAFDISVLPDLSISKPMPLLTALLLLPLALVYLKLLHNDARQGGVK